MGGVGGFQFQLTGIYKTIEIIILIRGRENHVSSKKIILNGQTDVHTEILNYIEQLRYKRHNVDVIICGSEATPTETGTFRLNDSSLKRKKRIKIRVYYFIWGGWGWEWGGVITRTITLRYISSMASKPITIRWITTGSQLDLKFKYSNELQTIFNEFQNKNHEINTSNVSPGLRSLGANKTGLIL